MLITIEICDDGEGAANITVKFDPELTDENRGTPAAKIAGEMLIAVNATKVEIASDD